MDEEIRLVARTLLQAIIDLSSKDKAVREEARAFLAGETEALDDICSVLGLNANRIKTVVKDDLIHRAPEIKRFIIAKLKEKEQENVTQ